MKTEVTTMPNELRPIDWKQMMTTMTTTTKH